MCVRHPSVAVFPLLLVAGCAVGPNYRSPDMALPASWTTAARSQPSGGRTSTADLATWWKALNDPTLDALIAGATESNLDLRVATARVREARAQRDVAAADFWPQVNLGAGYTYSGASGNVGTSAGTSKSGLLSKLLPAVTVRPGAAGVPGSVTLTPSSIARGGGAYPSVTLQPGAVSVPGGKSPAALTIRPPGATPGVTHPSRQENLFQVGFDATWELDVFGGIRRSVEAAEADTAASEESRRDVLVTLLSEVASDYVQLRGAQRRLDIALENIAAQRDTLELTQARHKAGFTTELDVSQAQGQLSTTESQVPLLQSTIRQSIFQLSVLLAQPPGALVAELDKAAPIPTPPPDIPLGLPSDLLRRRPDIRAAERQLAAATARIGEAMADLFPKFSLTGSFGPAASDINHLLDARSLGWSIGPGVSWPVFEGGRIRANIEVQNARQEQAAATYEKAVLTGLQDVESALVAYTNESRRHGILATAVGANQQSVQLSNELYARGLGAFLNVLDSQRALYLVQDELVQSETAAVTDLIALYKALGGGWDAPITATQVN